MKLLELTRCLQPGQKLSTVCKSNDFNRIMVVSILAISFWHFYEIKVQSDI